MHSDAPVVWESSDSERRVAGWMHLASIIAPLWFPFVVWLVAQQKSLYVAAHARQAAFEGIFWKALLLAFTVGSVIWSVVVLIGHFQTGFENFEWQQVAWKVGISLGVVVVLGVTNFVFSLFQAKAAFCGVWPRRALKRMKAGFRPC